MESNPSQEVYERKNNRKGSFKLDARILRIALRELGNQLLALLVGGAGCGSSFVRINY